MENFLLGLVAPAAASTARAATKLASLATEPFQNALETANQLLQEKSKDLKFIDPENAATDDPTQEISTTLKNRIVELLKENGIALEKPLEIRQSSFDGRIEILSDHPHRALIEGILNDDPELLQGFEKYSALSNDENEDAELTVVPEDLSSLLSHL